MYKLHKGFSNKLLLTIRRTISYYEKKKKKLNNITYNTNLYKFFMNVNDSYVVRL